jgi:mRNA interferase RelE/StbE
MNVLFKASFKKDLKRIKDPRLLAKIGDLIDHVKAVEVPVEIGNLSKLKGHDDFYRIRLGNFRIGVRITAEGVIFIRCLHRKDIYNFFP